MAVSHGHLIEPCRINMLYNMVQPACVTLLYAQIPFDMSKSISDIFPSSLISHLPYSSDIPLTQTHALTSLTNPTMEIRGWASMGAGFHAKPIYGTDWRIKKFR